MPGPGERGHIAARGQAARIGSEGRPAFLGHLAIPGLLRARWLATRLFRLRLALADVGLRRFRGARIDAKLALARPCRVRAVAERLALAGIQARPAARFNAARVQRLHGSTCLSRRSCRRRIDRHPFARVLVGRHQRSQRGLCIGGLADRIDGISGRSGSGHRADALAWPSCCLPLARSIEGGRGRVRLP